MKWMMPNFLYFYNHKWLRGLKQKKLGKIVAQKMTMQPKLQLIIEKC